MKEIKKIVEAYQKIDFNQNKAALATVVRVEGSSYRRTGARMLVMESGEWVGGISGGCLEGDALKKARLAMSQNKATLITYDTSDDDPYQIGVGLGCNGIIDVLITPLEPQDKLNAVSQIRYCLDQRSPNVIVTITALNRSNEVIQLGQVFRFDSTDHFNEIFPLDDIKEKLTEEIRLVLVNTKSISRTYTLADGLSVSLFIEIIPPAIQLYVYGSNYDVYPMVRMAKELGWKVIVVCNPNKMHRSLFAIADAVMPKDYVPVIDKYTAAISMCHDYETDYHNLQTLLKTDISYIGLLGPKKRTVKMYDRMNEEGKPITPENESRIFSPVGLDIGANTPEEIALSVCAEIRTNFSGRDAKRLKFRNKPIYDS
ncbi:XdhC family protein [Emticicia sp. BO119]|uniref:XdhC family protein n=1 Tax=Emticicia sp. BO119 TaxID=2757768 RepID=UPI0015F05244|nr:XdhC family protein [Emticicia sp. BO119]MBA4850233.1 XdhC family protein [Emticicia sp. BO119]